MLDAASYGVPECSFALRAIRMKTSINIFPCSEVSYSTNQRYTTHPSSKKHFAGTCPTHQSDRPSHFARLSRLTGSEIGSIVHWQKFSELFKLCQQSWQQSTLMTNKHVQPRTPFLATHCQGNFIKGMGGPGAPHTFAIDRYADVRSFWEGSGVYGAV